MSIGEPGRSTFAIPDAWTMVHELGHNLGLHHAPCGPNLTNVDRAFPHRDGTIGAWGYDFEDGALVPPTRPDFMSYCGPDIWVSEYFHSNMLRYHFEVGSRESGAALAAAGPSLLVWGGIEPNGAPFLEPAFVLDAAAALPSSSGPYRVTGVASDGATLFSLSFDMPRSADGEGSGSFAFAIPRADLVGRAAPAHNADRTRRLRFAGRADRASGCHDPESSNRPDPGDLPGPPGRHDAG
ncbi:M66 family metalloprotease [Candidatus Palauibacter sp.]|uniref:M66 family metalloprotease n=1 Tax=Candidatus Palauibacter sp. TaxID=3101350 RepID=UPI003CC58FA2